MKTALKYILLLAVATTLAACGPTLAQRKDRADIHYRMGVVHLDSKNFSGALVEFTRAVEAYPGEPSYHNALGLAYFARKMNEEAKAEMKKAIKLDPKYSEARVNLSAVYMVEGNWDGVIDECKKAAGNVFYSTPEFAYYNMGSAYYNKGDYQGAITAFRKAVELAPAYSAAYYNLGSSYDRTGNLRESADAFARAVELSPDYVDAHYNLGVELTKLKDKDGAVAEFKKVMELAPESDLAGSAMEYIKLLR